MLVNRKNIRTRRCPIYVILCILFIMVFYIKTGSYVKAPSFSEVFPKLIRVNSCTDCNWKFDHYSPSPWELYWYNNINELQDQVCAKLMENNEMNRSIRALEYIMDLQKRISNQSLTTNEHDDLLSKMHYRCKCVNLFQSDFTVSQYIEPLIGLIRDPLTICPFETLPPQFNMSKEDEIQSKRFWLLGPSAPYQNFSRPITSMAPWLYQQSSKKILFDLGASFFNGMDNETRVSTTIGARWFYEYFLPHSLRFDRIVAFEAAQSDPKSYWQQIPIDLIDSFTFINVGVETTGKFNPWNILKATATVHDYVIIKLDIDNQPIENQLIQQVLNDESISSLIDELFFEMHVSVKDMMFAWGTPPGTLNDSYVLFTKLRRLGIRMHSWP